MPGLLRGVVRTAAVAGTATAVSNRVSRRQAERWSRQSGYAAPPPGEEYEPTPPPHPQVDPIERLAQLGELKEKGLLTDEEFAAQKARLLA